MHETHPKLLVLGIGNPSCGDDAVGPAVIERIRIFQDDNIVTLSVPAEASSIISAMKGHDNVVLVDAILSQNATGALHVFDASRGPLPTELFPHFSSHSFGIPEAIELARVLGELPPKIIVLGIEGAQFEPGEGMSPRVAEAVEDAVRWIFERAEQYVPTHSLH